jgi:hypothetical protein
VRKLTTDPRFEKLPKWARDGITYLERDYAATEKALSEARMHGPEDTNTVGRIYTGADVVLPRDCRVVFNLGENREITAGIDRYTNGDFLALMGSGQLSGKLQITSRSSNTCEVRCGGAR